MSSLSDWNGIRTYKHLVRKRTLNHFAKLDVVMFSSLVLVSLNRFQTLSSVSIVDFEQTNTDWVTFVTNCHTIQSRIFLKYSFLKL